jgi:AraC family transcriptional activator of mtrCDE
MDALSDILQMIRLQSTVYFRSDFKSPWGMKMDASSVAQFHLVVRGSCYVNFEGSTNPVLLSSGDVIVFPHGKAHWLADEPGNKKIAGQKVLESIKNNQPLFKGDRISTTLICGHFEFDRDIEHPFFDALPDMIHISDDSRKGLNWLESVAGVIMHEVNSPEPGSHVIVDRLAEVLFIQVLRSYMKQQEATTGFFSALADRQINNALKMIHSKPENSWTLEMIAKDIGMSRSAFAARFKNLVGETPMEYITRWRMARARDLLKDYQKPLIVIAEQVGYTSEAAFNRAFKRVFKHNPGFMRRSLMAGR